MTFGREQEVEKQKERQRVVFFAREFYPLDVRESVEASAVVQIESRFPGAERIGGIIRSSREHGNQRPISAGIKTTHDYGRYLRSTIALANNLSTLNGMKIAEIKKLHGKTLHAARSMVHFAEQVGFASDSPYRFNPIETPFVQGTDEVDAYVREVVADMGAADFKGLQHATHHHFMSRGNLWFDTLVDIHEHEPHAGDVAKQILETTPWARAK